MGKETVAHRSRSWWRGMAVLVVALAGLLPAARVAGQEPDLGIVSRRYIVVDAETGEIYAQRGAHDRVAPASLTKIFTAIEAIEEGPGALAIVTTETDQVPWDATQVGFGPGETFTLEELIYGMMLPSGNDAARAVARALGAEPGDTAAEATARFMARVNDRIRAMGLTETNLVNPDGWGVPGHYSSAYDLAAFTMYALKYPRFIAAISTETYRTASGYELINTNKKLGVDDDLVGGKTGYDDTAGYCLMQVARRGDDTMIAITLGGVAPDVWYEDNRRLLDYAFERKAAARAAGLGIGGEIVRVRDPDAAVIERIARAEAVAGPSLAPVPGTATEPEPAGVAAPLPDAAPAAGRGAAGPAALSAGLLPALAVAAVLAVAATISAGRGRGRRNPAVS